MADISLPLRGRSTWTFPVYLLSSRIKNKKWDTIPNYFYICIGGSISYGILLYIFSSPLPHYRRKYPRILASTQFITLHYYWPCAVQHPIKGYFWLHPPWTCIPGIWAPNTRTRFFQLALLLC